MEARGDGARVSPGDVQRRSRQRVVCPDQLNLEGVKERVAKFARDSENFPVGNIEVIVGDFVRGDVEAPLALVTFFQPERCCDRDVLLEFVEESGPGVDLIDYQRP